MFEIIGKNDGSSYRVVVGGPDATWGQVAGDAHVLDLLRDLAERGTRVSATPLGPVYTVDPDVPESIWCALFNHHRAVDRR